MAKNITLMGANYPDVPAVDLPKTGGGTARFIDQDYTQCIELVNTSTLKAYRSGGLVFVAFLAYDVSTTGSGNIGTLSNLSLPSSLTSVIAKASISGSAGGDVVISLNDQNGQLSLYNNNISSSVSGTLFGTLIYPTNDNF